MKTRNGNAVTLSTISICGSSSDIGQT